jgi:hypothetical protein
MAVTLRFRPVVFGYPVPTAVFHLVEEPCGRTFFRDLEVASPIAVSLEEVTQSDLPQLYRRADLEITILPVQKAT